MKKKEFTPEEKHIVREKAEELAEAYFCIVDHFKEEKRRKFQEFIVKTIKIIFNIFLRYVRNF